MIEFISTKIFSSHGIELFIFWAIIIMIFFFVFSKLENIEDEPIVILKEQDENKITYTIINLDDSDSLRREWVYGSRVLLYAHLFLYFLRLKSFK